MEFKKLKMDLLNNQQHCKGRDCANSLNIKWICKKSKKSRFIRRDSKIPEDQMKILKIHLKRFSGKC